MKKVIFVLALVLSMHMQATTIRVVMAGEEDIQLLVQQLRSIRFDGTTMVFNKRYTENLYDDPVMMTKDASEITKMIFNEATTTNYTLQSNVLRVYPNPASEVVFVEGLLEPTMISLISMSGQLIKSEQGTQLNVSDVPQGVYLLLVDNFVSKLIIE